MTDTIELFSGVGVIIDDAFDEIDGNKYDQIWNIKASLIEKHIPLLTYSALPQNEEIPHFKNVSFILLDWDLWGGGLSISDIRINDTIQFIKDIRKVCFFPLFIFTNEDKDIIIQRLKDDELYVDGDNNHIFLKNKPELDNSETLFNEITGWLKKTPSVYVLKEWEKSIAKAKADLFWDMYNLSPRWASIMVSTIEKDGVSVSHEMNELLFENLRSRVYPVDFDNEVIKGCSSAYTPSEIRKVIQGEMFIEKGRLPNDMIFTGDLFKIDTDYYINIRPQCDCIPRDNTNNIDDICLYLIKGNAIEMKDACYSRIGNFADKEINFTVLFNDKVIQFTFKELLLLEFEHLKTYREGRLLPPFITKLLQKYGLFIQRQGLPRIPNEAVEDLKKKVTSKT